MVNNKLFTNAIAVELKYRPNQHESSYYKIYKDSNTLRQIRVSNHGTYLRTWIDKDYDPTVSTNMSIVFSSNGVPTNDCIINTLTSEPFNDCTLCTDHQSQTHTTCKPRQVRGISNKKRTFTVVQFVYNCENMALEDAPILVAAIKQAVSIGVYNDPFANNPSKAAKTATLTPVEPETESIVRRMIIENKSFYHDMIDAKKIIRLTEADLHSIIKDVLQEIIPKSLCKRKY